MAIEGTTRKTHSAIYEQEGAPNERNMNVLEIIRQKKETPSVRYTHQEDLELQSDFNCNGVLFGINLGERVKSRKDVREG